MPPLSKTLRNMIETVAREARDKAESGAKAMLGYLGATAAAPPNHLNEAKLDLRERLRLHGERLGDSLDGGETQAMVRLVEETAYEHWHRMLFAKNLAANGMLMYPGPSGPAPVTMEDCGDFASDNGAADGWDLAAKYAARMLPRIFRAGSPVFKFALPSEIRQDLERLISGLPPEVFAEPETFGWAFQAWQTRRKAEVNLSETKIGARELPAVTQLFTELIPTFYLSRPDSILLSNDGVSRE